jgi:hypothetical protein
MTSSKDNFLAKFEESYCVKHLSHCYTLAYGLLLRRQQDSHEHFVHENLQYGNNEHLYHIHKMSIICIQGDSGGVTATDGAHF